jgi:hypothetical protein
MPEFNRPAAAVPVIEKRRDIQTYGWLIGLQIDPRGEAKALALFEQPQAKGGSCIAAFLVRDSELFCLLQEHLTNAALARLDQDRQHSGLLKLWHDGSEWRSSETLTS